MDKSILRRITALENRVPSDVVIIAITEDGQQANKRVKDCISCDGELKKGYSGIGSEVGSLVIRGSNLRDIDRILKYYREEAEKS